MLIIGHRGSAGTKPENTITSLRTALKAGADMIEFDVRITRDGHAVLHHDFMLLRTHRRLDIIERLSLAELRKRTAGSNHPMVTLEEALRECYGKTIINIELKRKRAAAVVLDVLAAHTGGKTDWEAVVFSSFYPFALQAVRRRAPKAQLALLHAANPLKFMLWHRALSLSAVGFYRAHYTQFALEVAHQLGLFTYAYTVDRPEAMVRLAARGFDGVVTNFPQLLREARDAMESTP